MTYEQVNALVEGLYRIYWVEDKSDVSVAAVGRNRQGQVWYAPTNWVSIPWYDWSRIHAVELITTQAQENETLRRTEGEYDV